MFFQLTLPLKTPLIREYQIRILDTSNQLKNNLSERQILEVYMNAGKIMVEIYISKIDHYQDIK